MKKTCCYSADEIVTAARHATAEAINFFLNAPDALTRNSRYNRAASLLGFLISIDAISSKQWLRMTSNMSDIRFWGVGERSFGKAAER